MATTADKELQQLLGTRSPSELLADFAYQARLLKSARDDLTLIAGDIENEGDRCYFGSTNDADDFREAVEALDDWDTERIVSPPSGRDLYAEIHVLRKAVERAGKTFTGYAALHAAKNTEEAEAKRAVNQVLADAMFAALTAAPEPQQ